MLILIDVYLRLNKVIKFNKNKCTIVFEIYAKYEPILFIETNT